MASNASKSQVMTADYSSGTQQHQFRHDVGTITANASTGVRVDYLAKLRESVVKLQDEVNAFLTDKMEEDKKFSDLAQGADDKKEEENYGEEIVEDS